MQKQHPAEAYQAELIARAASYQVCIFLGVGRYARAEALSLDGAEAAAKRLEAEHPNGRRALIYAITNDGRPALIVDETRKWRTKMEMQAQAKAQMTPDQKAAAKREAAAARMRKFRANQKAKTAQAPTPKAVLLADAKLAKNSFKGAPKLRAKAPPAGANGEAIASVPAMIKPVAPIGEALAIIKAGCKPIADAPAAAKAKPLGARAAAAAKLMADAQAGILPALPDMTAKTHDYWRRHLISIQALVEAGDIAALQANAIQPLSGSRKLICCSGFERL